MVAVKFPFFLRQLQLLEVMRPWPLQVQAAELLPIFLLPSWEVPRRLLVLALLQQQ